MEQLDYESIKAMVIAEQRAERKARAEERARIEHEAWHMFDTTEKKYLPLLIAKYGKRTGNYDCVDVFEQKIYDAIRATLGILKERNRKTAYLNGKTEEANEILAQLLEQMLNG